MGFFVAEVHDELFQGWIKETQNNFHLMIETMVRVAEEIKKDVQLRTVPLRTGKLSRSFRETIITDNSRMKVVEIKMSALNERTGYDYAMVQHRGYHITKDGWTAHYKYHRDTHDLGFTTYKPKSDGGYKKSLWFENPVGAEHRGMQQYMYWSIIHTENTAFEMIETDYLSMFMGGFIV